MRSSHIRASIASYFRYKRQCPLIAFERACLEIRANPDILIVNKNRMLIEVEVKTSVADFKNDAKKRIWQIRNSEYHKTLMPYQFYYAVPLDLKDKCLKVMNGWEEKDKKCGKMGLLSVMDKEEIGWNDVTVYKKSPINKKSKPISLKNIVKMSLHQSGSLCTIAIKIAKYERLKHSECRTTKTP